MELSKVVMVTFGSAVDPMHFDQPWRINGTPESVFSDGLTRLTFVMLTLLSTPVGIHHEFMEPGISTTWKMLHTVTTYGVAIPSFITAFAIFASFELVAIKQGRRGLPPR
jgi:hypothetical protein